jgi:antitoxin (DNA-binding transcriptional repressor) of toxin-antitoxin stability system
MRRPKARQVGTGRSRLPVGSLADAGFGSMSTGRGSGNGSAGQSATEFARNVADIVTRVFYRGGRFSVERGGRPVVDLVPPARGRRLGDLPGILASLPELGAEEGECLARELEDARREQGPQPAGPWRSQRRPLYFFNGLLSPR